MLINNKIKKLKLMMEQEKLDAVFITDIATTTYLTTLHFDHWGWSGGALFVPINGDNFYVIGPAHDKGRIKNLFNIEEKYYLSWHPALGDKKEITVFQRLLELLQINSINKGVLGYDRGRTSAVIDHNIKEALSETKVILRDVSKKIDNLMMIKEHDEIQVMRRVAAIADSGIQSAIENIKIGRTESQIAGEVIRSMHYSGADYTWAQVNVGSGYNNHMDTWTTNKVIQRNDIIKVGCHPSFLHYRADTLRTFCLGVPSEKIKVLSKITTEAGYEMLDSMKPGVRVSKIDNIFREKMKKNNFEMFGLWRLGHGIGTTHLPPYMHSGDDTILQENMVVVVQPFAYYPEGGGYGLEHMILVNKNGIENLNKMPIEMKILDI